MYTYHFQIYKCKNKLYSDKGQVCLLLIFKLMNAKASFKETMSIIMFTSRFKFMNAKISFTETLTMYVYFLFLKL